MVQSSRVFYVSSCESRELEKGKVAWKKKEGERKRDDWWLKSMGNGNERMEGLERGRPRSRLLMIGVADDW